jgi:alkaline phosphatase
MKIIRFIILFLITISVAAYSATYKVPGYEKFKSVIILIGDGMTSSQITLARWYKKDFLAMDRMYRGEILTNSADSMITDSAAAATAFATGCKITSQELGVLPAINSNLPRMLNIEIEKRCLGELEKPIATILEAAKLKGKSVGLVSTSEVQDATPAGFSSHINNRNNLAEIAKQQVYQDIDVVFGGGKKYLLPASTGGSRKDEDNLAEVLRERRCLLINSLDELKNMDINKVWGLFADADLAFNIDRKELNLEQPSLTEMTKAAIGILSKDPDGFFLMAEGSKIDWAAHDNDPVGVISDLLTFDDAVKAALEFAAENGDTLVLVLSDHGSGGMSLGSKSGGKVPYHTSYEEVFAPLKKARLTSEGVTNMIMDYKCDAQKTAGIIEKYYGIGDLTQEQLKTICTDSGKKIRKLLGQIISEKSLIGWTTTTHTGEDMILYSNYAIERNAEIKTLFDNTEIASIVDELLDLDIAGANESLYQDAQSAFEDLGAEMSIEKSDDGIGYKIVIVKKLDSKTIRMELLVDTDICIFDAGNPKMTLMNGITIFSKTGKAVYIPYEALDIFKIAVDSSK